MLNPDAPPEFFVSDPVAAVRVPNGLRRGAITPRTAEGCDGLLHVVWAEDIGKDAKAGRRLLHAYFDANEAKWSNPSEVLAAERVDWEEQASGGLVVDSLGRLHLALAVRTEENGWTVAVGAWTGGAGWKVELLDGPMPSYVRLDVLPSRMTILVVGSGLDVPPQSVWTAESLDGGRTWKKWHMLWAGESGEKAYATWLVDENGSSVAYWRINDDAGCTSFARAVVGDDEPPQAVTIGGIALSGTERLIRHANGQITIAWITVEEATRFGVRAVSWGSDGWEAPVMATLGMFAPVAVVSPDAHERTRRVLVLGAAPGDLESPTTALVSKEWDLSSSRPVAETACGARP